jgi:hypothetical protein
LPTPFRRSTVDTVESGIAIVSAISAAVIRKRRSARTTATRSGAVRLATSRGAEERFNEAGYAGRPVPADPLTRTAHTHSRSCSSSHDRPTLFNDTNR